MMGRFSQTKSSFSDVETCSCTPFFEGVAVQRLSQRTPPPSVSPPLPKFRMSIFGGKYKKRELLNNRSLIELLLGGLRRLPSVVARSNP